MATDLRKTFAIFTYKCDGNSFPDKATVGYVTEDGMVSNQVTLQDNSHKVICNCTTEEYVNIVLDISGTVHNANFFIDKTLIHLIFQNVILMFASKSRNDS